MPKKILIIDDDPIVVKFITNVLNDNGYETVSALNGAEAFELLKKEKPDLITLDIQMPEEWGPRFYRKLSKSKVYQNIPVVVISGLASTKYSIPKSSGYLSKPFETEDLLNLISNIIGK